MTRFDYSELHMGVRVTITCYAHVETLAERACIHAFARIAEVEQIMSDYRPGSELMRLCTKAGLGPIDVSPELHFVLRRSQQLAELSFGAFDVTCGAVTRLWRDSRVSGIFPSPEALKDAMSRSGYFNLCVIEDSQSVSLAVNVTQLDLGGIAKGFACDEALAVLRSHGVTSALVDASGDIVVSDPPPGKSGWSVDVNGIDRERFVLRNSSISTSGDSEQFTEIDGCRYSHIVDPRTGIGLTNHVQATVIAKDGITSDSLTKVCSVLGEDASWPILRHFDAKAIIISGE